MEGKDDEPSLCGERADSQSGGSAKVVKGRVSRASMAWNSGFYQFAEAIREFSHGSVNYKALYSLVGTRGRYINHESASVRRRTAANLSRLMHSCRYADDMRARHADDQGVFRSAAAELAERLRISSNLEAPDLLEVLLTSVWAGLRTGLSHEFEAGRPDVNLSRLDSECANLAAWSRAIARVGGDPVQDVLTMYFHILAFGCLDERFSRTLVAPTPGFPDEGTSISPDERLLRPKAPDAADGAAPDESSAGRPRAFLMKLVGDTDCAISSIWTIDSARPFTFGRYADCDVIDRCPRISRLHCRIYLLDGYWYVEDVVSLHGTRVFERAADGSWTLVFDSLASADGDLVHRLEYGDVVELAGSSRYQFGCFLPDANGADGGVGAVSEAPARE